MKTTCNIDNAWPGTANKLNLMQWWFKKLWRMKAVEVKCSGFNIIFIRDRWKRIIKADLFNNMRSHERTQCWRIFWSFHCLVGGKMKKLEKMGCLFELAQKIKIGTEISFSLLLYCNNNKPFRLVVAMRWQSGFYDNWHYSAPVIELKKTLKHFKALAPKKWYSHPVWWLTISIHTRFRPVEIITSEKHDQQNWWDAPKLQSQ